MGSVKSLVMEFLTCFRSHGPFWSVTQQFLLRYECPNARAELKNTRHTQNLKSESAVSTLNPELLIRQKFTLLVYISVISMMMISKLDDTSVLWFLSSYEFLTPLWKVFSATVGLNLLQRLFSGNYCWVVTTLASSSLIPPEILEISQKLPKSLYQCTI